MKRLLTVVCALMLLVSCAHAAKSSSASPRYFAFNEPAVAGLYGRTAILSFTRKSSGPSGKLILQDEAGNVLSSTTVSSGQRQGSFRVSIREGMPLGQTVTMLFEGSGAPIRQDTCLLSADSAKHDCIRQVDTAEKKIAITFDTANGAGKSAALLDLLARYGVHSTFFLQGEFAISNAKLIQRMDREGHELGNHSMHHPDMREISNSEIYREITRCNEMIEKITGKPVTLYRPPAGYNTYRDRGISRALGCEVILWTFDSHDGFSKESQETVWTRLQRYSEPGAIILMHVYGKHTLTLLEKYVPMMQKKGYQFVTVSELLQCKPKGSKGK